MTQPELIIKYIEEHGSLLPAKIAAVVYKDQMFGSETSKRCRELRAKGILRSEGDGRFERFYLKDSAVQETKLLPMTDKIKEWNETFYKSVVKQEIKTKTLF